MTDAEIRQKLQARRPAPRRLFIHVYPGLAVRVRGVPGRVTAVRSTAWGCAIEIEVNGTRGEYHPRDFLEDGIIETAEGSKL